MIIYKKLKPFISLVCTLLIIFSAVSIPVYAADTKSVTASTNASVKQGSYAYCYIYIDSSEELAALDVAVHFDPAKVKILDVYNSISCTLYDSVTNTDNIQFSYIFDGEGAASKARLFYFRYQVLSNADIGNSYFDITIGEAYDNALNDVAVSGSRCNFIIAETITNKTCSVYSSSSMSTSIEQEFTIGYRFSTYQIASGTAVISYDPELFEVIEVTNGAFLTNKIVDVNTELNGEIYISFLGTEYYSNTNFIFVTFKTIKNVTETSKIVFKATELIDKELNSISCNGYTTNVNIAFDSTYTGDAPAMKLDGAFSYEDMQITLVVTLEENSRLGAGDFVIAFDPGLVSYNSCTKGFSPSFFNINDKNVENGELKFHIISLSDITTEETVLTVIFDVKHPYSCESADFTLSGKNLTDSLTESILLNFIDASILFEYRITFCNEDGSILKSDMYHYGDDVVAPDAPVKEKDDYYIYIFKGWDKEIVNCCTDAEYKAVFAAEHYHTYTAVVTTPTCTEKGYTTYTCACGDSYVADYVDANGHSYTSEITTPATHLAEGVTTFTCTCGDSYTEAIEKTPEHTYEAVVTAPTCTEKGYTTYTCACGDSYVADYVDANGHSFTNYLSDNNATCTADGTKTAKCDRCDATDTITDVGSAKGHSPAEAVKENEVAATCTTDGSYDSVVYCSECNTELSREAKTTEKFGHNWGEWTVETVASCTEKGTEKRVCANDESHVETRDIDTIAHTEATKEENRVEATCTANGSYDSVVYCSVCKAEISRKTVKTDKLAHTVVTDKAVAATCVKAGKTEGKHCSVCNTVITAQKKVPATGKHTYKTATTKATTTKDGKAVTACTVCGKVSKSTTIYKASSIKLSKTSFTYNGKAQKPTITVKNSKGIALKNGTDYTVKYDSGCKNTGKYAVKITFKGNYSGSKTLYFNILPSKTSKLTVSQSTTSIKATWNKVTGASGYKVTLYNSKGKAVKTVDTNKTTYTFSKLSKGTTYKVRVTAYKTIDSKKVSSSVYTQLTTATKPGTPTLKVTAGSKKATLSWNKQTGATGYVVYMATSKNGKYSKIATVKGKLSYTKTGLTKGKTYYFKVAAYSTINNKTIYGEFSAVKSVKIK